MNVTEKQKQIMIHFMCIHPDFGRGRLRYNRENKKKLDELWEELTLQVNSAGNGPQKLPKEWAKTWRDWKSNLLKRVATYKSYIGETGSGPPISLDLSPADEVLLDFVTSEASRMPGVPEGGVLDGPKLSTSFAKSVDALNTSTSFLNSGRPVVVAEDPLCSVLKLGNERSHMHSSGARTSPDTPFYSSPLTDDAENHSINIFFKVHRSTEKVQENETSEGTSKLTIPIRTKRRLSNGADTGSKNTKRQQVRDLFQQHTSEYSDVQQRMLQLKKEKLKLAKEKFEFKKKAHEEQTEMLGKLTQKVTELTNAILSIAPQYLE